jgi:hypothetical protein
VVDGSDAFFQCTVVALCLWNVITGGSIIHFDVEVIGYSVHHELEFLVTVNGGYGENSFVVDTGDGIQSRIEPFTNIISM